MKIILYMAMSVNGYIARSDGTEDFISAESWQSFLDVARKCGALVIGRKTYETVKSWGDKEYDFDNIKDVEKVVISSNPTFAINDDYLIAGSPEKAIDKLEAKNLKSLVVVGGSTANASFMKAGLIDEIIFNIEPFALGNGITVFAKEEFGFELELLEVRQLPGGIIQSHYRVKKIK